MPDDAIIIILRWLGVLDSNALRAHETHKLQPDTLFPRSVVGLNFQFIMVLLELFQKFLRSHSPIFIVLPIGSL